MIENLNENNWKPYVGKACEFSDNEGDWRIGELSDKDEYGFWMVGGVDYNYCRPYVTDNEKDLQAEVERLNVVISDALRSLVGQ